ncbi:MAG: hypothetical protein K9N10_08765 [Deltaproteobacteria bacterium]|nr:hypothetical protein [Deltaproteobacteria bacterium]
MQRIRMSQKKSPRSGNRPADKPGVGSGKRGTQRPVPIVGLGASAGGMEALNTFFAAVPETGGMVRSAINTGLVDMVLSPEAMPQKLIHYFSHPPAREDNQECLQKNWPFKGKSRSLRPRFRGTFNAVTQAVDRETEFMEKMGWT